MDVQDWWLVKITYFDLLIQYKMFKFACGVSYTIGEGDIYISCTM